MPRTEHNIGRQRSTKHEITVNGLLTLRGRQLQCMRLGTNPDAQTNIDAIDRVLVNVIGYEGDIAEESRDFRRVSTFKRGELRRVVADIMRKADAPLTTLDVAKLALATKGLEASYSRKIKTRVNTVLKVLQRMERGGSVCRSVGCDGLTGWKSVRVISCKQKKAPVTLRPFSQD